VKKKAFLIGGIVVALIAIALCYIAVFPLYYTNRPTPLGAVDTASADSACQSVEGHARLLCLANLLKQDLDPNLLERLQLPYSVSAAQRWSNFPVRAYRDRVGVSLGEFSPAQLRVVKAILQEAAGIGANEGYDELEQILNADDYLKEHSFNQLVGFASGNYNFAFIGTPAATGTWSLYFGGHHVAFGTTYRDGVLIGATPQFRGVEPFGPFRQNGRDNDPLAQEQDAFAAMLGALSSEEQGRARLSQTYTNVVAGPQQDDNFPSTRVGVRVGDLDPGKQDLVLGAIETYVRDVDPANADAIIARYRAELADTYVSFSGTLEVNTLNDYVRIDGPAVWIEISMQHYVSLLVDGIHPHSVWRDRSTDYGGNE
jgi:hypothetical protein